ncbi:MAG TPA: hypothetical protein VHP58_03805 [Alphaproteobacteria bacterium]|nr:hypothetical protein [Alphaproteobacteria bacterium]
MKHLPFILLALILLIAPASAQQSSHVQFDGKLINRSEILYVGVVTCESKSLPTSVANILKDDKKYAKATMACWFPLNMRTTLFFLSGDGYFIKSFGTGGEFVSEEMARAAVEAVYKPFTEQLLGKAPAS